MTNNSGYNTYIGARYIPLFMGEWDKNKNYEPLTVVMNKGASYTSKTYVPSGIEIDNLEYWALSANYNEQVEEYRKETENVKNNLYYANVKAYGAKGDGITNDTQAFIDAMNSDYDCVYIPSGEYVINSILTVKKSLYSDGGKIVSPTKFIVEDDGIKINGLAFSNSCFEIGRNNRDSQLKRFFMEECEIYNGSKGENGVIYIFNSTFVKIGNCRIFNNNTIPSISIENSTAVSVIENSISGEGKENKGIYFMPPNSNYTSYSGNIDVSHNYIGRHNEGNIFIDETLRSLDYGRIIGNQLSNTSTTKNIYIGNANYTIIIDGNTYSGSRVYYNSENIENIFSNCMIDYPFYFSFGSTLGIGLTLSTNGSGQTGKLPANCANTFTVYKRNVSGNVIFNKENDVSGEIENGSLVVSFNYLSLEDFNNKATGIKPMKPIEGIGSSAGGTSFPYLIDSNGNLTVYGDNLTLNGTLSSIETGVESGGKVITFNFERKLKRDIF